MAKICTDIDQSKKLLELGIDVITADMRYGYIAPYDFSDRMYDGGYDEVPYPKDFLLKNPNFSVNEYDGELPAWSLSALLELMPKIILNENDAPWQPNLSKGYYNNLWQCVYCSDIHITEWYEDPLDAAFEMVCWLKENNKLINMSYKYFPNEFSSYEDYIKYLKEKGLALEVPERKCIRKTNNDV